MSDLDKKLEAIQSEIGCCRYHMESKEFRDSIKQAFIDEGYAQVRTENYRDEDRNKYRHYVISYPDGSGESFNFPLFEYATGQEWYDRFTEELVGTMFAEDDALGALNTCKAAAKRASGIESAKEQK